MSSSLRSITHMVPWRGTRALGTLAAATNQIPSAIVETPPQTSATVAKALELIKSEPSHWVTVVFLGRRFLLTPRDVLTVPRIRDVAVGDVLALTAIVEVGSRQYSLRGNPTLPRDTVRVNATIIEHTRGALEKIEKFKRRKGYSRSLDHKQPYTRLRIGSIEL